VPHLPACCPAGKAKTGRSLVRGGCNKVIFIGSTTVGRAVMRDAAETLTPVTLELGGKDPFIVCDDVHLPDVVPVAMRAAFQSCGQNCVAAERFIVQDGVYEQFVARCVALASRLRQGNPLGAHGACLE
jgi:acyl-CoA reductase-like NAD-dependent aldehyde dehydrogenase